MRRTYAVALTAALWTGTALPATASPEPIPVVDERVQSCTYVIGVGEYCVWLGPIR